MNIQLVYLSPKLIQTPKNMSEHITIGYKSVNHRVPSHTDTDGDEVDTIYWKPPAGLMGSVFTAVSTSTPKLPVMDSPLVASPPLNHRSKDAKG